MLIQRLSCGDFYRRAKFCYSLWVRYIFLEKLTVSTRLKCYLWTHVFRDVKSLSARSWGLAWTQIIHPNWLITARSFSRCKINFLICDYLQRKRKFLDMFDLIRSKLMSIVQIFRWFLNLVLIVWFSRICMRDIFVITGHVVALNLTIVKIVLFKAVET